MSLLDICWVKPVFQSLFARADASGGGICNVSTGFSSRYFDLHVPFYHTNGTKILYGEIY